ncbi:uncharacterized protein LOC133806615 [Humulus lupulus]|uniref:uncharacterized protein LOC133806615 n=1 Tax=Humulus lupulus TaxID=3486 RepID=UPI002B40B1E9|nr:uncharacterized protein LOC133806615 [Humulus lupulus]
MKQSEPKPDALNQFMTETRASIQSLDTQIGQLATLMKNRSEENLPSTTEVNPKEQCNAISLRSGKELKGPKAVDKEKKMSGSNVTENLQKQQGISIDYHIKIPYPERLQRNKLDKQFAKFLEVFRKLHINIPFSKALEQMPTYLKFLKEILSKKRKLEEYETIVLTKECSAILQKKLPPKLKYPGSFTIPCSIRGSVVTKALCDLGASVNLMNLSIFHKLKLGEARPTTVFLQMADRSIKYPRGIIEDVLVKVDKFIFPADFIVLDMEEDTIPIILGRPFLATGRALIDVQKGELKLRVQNKVVTFKVFVATEIPSCCRVDVVKRGDDELGVTRKKSMLQCVRTVCHRVKKIFSGKARMLHERWKVTKICNIKKRASSHDTMTLKDMRGGLDPS